MHNPEMFSGEVAHKRAVCEENGERKRQIYEGMHIESEDSKESRNGSYTKTVNNDVDVDNDDENSMEKNYSCHYKIKSVQMSAIRCRLEEQQHEERKLYYHQQKQQHPSQHLREEGAQSVINLARSNAILDAMCATEAAVIQQQQQQQHHHHYGLSAHSSHIAYTGAHQHHYLKPRADVSELTTSHYSNSSPPPHNSSLDPRTQTSPALASVSASATEEAATTTNSNSSSSSAAVAAAAAAAAANRRDHNIDYSTLFVQLSGTLPTLYRCVNCNKIVSNRWHHANIHRPQSHVCPVCGQKFTRRDNMKAHCKIKHADMKDHFFSHYVHM